MKVPKRVRAWPASLLPDVTSTHLPELCRINFPCCKVLGLAISETILFTQLHSSQLDALHDFPADHWGLKSVRVHISAVEDERREEMSGE